MLYKTKETDGSLSIRSKKYTGLEIEITRNEGDRVQHILGVRLTLDEDDEEEYIYCLDQEKVLAGNIIESPFIRYDAEIIYRER